MDEVLNTVVQEGIIEKITLSKDLRPLRASYMDKGVGKGKKTVPSRGVSSEDLGDIPISSKLRLLDIKADSKV